MIKLVIAAALLGSAATAVAAPTRASSDQPPTVRVHTADLDLSQPDGAKTLHHRIAVAINTVCGWPVDGSMGEMLANGRCRFLAARGADNQLAALRGGSTMLALTDTRAGADRR